MKLVPLLVLAVLAPAATAPQEQVLEFRVAQGGVLKKAFRNRMTMKVESVALSINGQRVPSEALGKFELHLAEEMQAVINDKYEELDGTRPVRVRRTFERITGESRRSSRTEEGETDDSFERGSELQGRSVVFQWDKNASTWRTRFADGRDADESYKMLAELEREVDYVELLPPHPVAVDDHWELDIKLFDRLITPGGELALAPVDGSAEEDDQTRMMNDMLAKNRSGTFTATYRGVRRVAGADLAIVELTCKLWSDGESEGQNGGAPSATSMAMSFDLCGELTWNLAEGHFQTLDVAGNVGMLVTQHGDYDPEDGPRVTTHQTLDFMGTMSLYAEIVR